MMKYLGLVVILMVSFSAQAGKTRGSGRDKAVKGSEAHMSPVKKAAAKLNELLKEHNLPEMNLEKGGEIPIDIAGKITKELNSLRADIEANPKNAKNLKDLIEDASILLESIGKFENSKVDGAHILANVAKNIINVMRTAVVNDSVNLEAMVEITQAIARVARMETFTLLDIEGIVGLAKKYGIKLDEMAECKA